jgi:hypothetical protein
MFAAVFAGARRGGCIFLYFCLILFTVISLNFYL